MDYPHPTVNQNGSKIDLSDAYAMGIGEFDKIAINWGYREFDKGADEKAELDKIVASAIEKGFLFLSDQDARPDGSVHPQAHLWDNGSNAVEELKKTIRIREIALKGFGTARIPKGTPYSSLEEVLVPVYMFHRFQTQAASKAIGGAYYSFGLKGDARPVFTPASAKEQNEALDALLETLSPEFLALSPELIKLIPPRAYRYGANARETFKRRTGMSFDPLGPTEASAQLTLSLLLNPERVSRLASQNVLDKNLPSLESVLDKITKKLWVSAGLRSQGYHGQIRRTLAIMYLHELLRLSLDKSVSVEARIQTLGAINYIKRLSESGDAFGSLAKGLITRFEERPSEFEVENFFVAPDGQPIDQDYDWLGLDCMD